MVLPSWLRVGWSSSWLLVPLSGLAWSGPPLGLVWVGPPPGCDWGGPPSWLSLGCLPPGLNMGGLPSVGFFLGWLLAVSSWVLSPLVIPWTFHMGHYRGAAPQRFLVLAWVALGWISSGFSPFCSF